MVRNFSLMLMLSTSSIVLYASQDIKVEYKIDENIDLIDDSTGEKIGNLQYVVAQRVNLSFHQQAPGYNRHHIQPGSQVPRPNPHHIQPGQSILFQHNRHHIQPGQNILFQHRRQASDTTPVYQTSLTGIHRSIPQSTTMQEAYALGAKDSLQKYGAEIMKAALENAADESKKHTEAISVLNKAHEFDAMLNRKYTSDLTNYASNLATSAFYTGASAGFIVGCVYVTYLSAQKK